MSAPQSAAAVLDTCFLETRCKIIEIAANLDRIDRAPGGAASDGRIAELKKAVAVLLENGPGRAEKCQQLFSLPYDPNWRRPQ